MHELLSSCVGRCLPVPSCAFSLLFACPHQPTKPEKMREEGRRLQLCAECRCRARGRGGSHWAGCRPVSSPVLPCPGLQRTVRLPERQLAASASAACARHCWRRWAAACSAPLLPRALLNTKNNQLWVDHTRCHANRVHSGIPNKAVIQLGWRHIVCGETKAVPQPLLVSVAKRSQPLSSSSLATSHITAKQRSQS